MESNAYSPSTDVHKAFLVKHSVRILYFVLRTPIFPNARKYEHIMMSVFMSQEPLSKIIDAKVFTHSGIHEIRGDTRKCYRSDASQGDSARQEH